MSLAAQWSSLNSRNMYFVVSERKYIRFMIWGDDAVIARLA